MDCLYIEKISATQFRTLFHDFLGRPEYIGYAENSIKAAEQMRTNLVNKLYERMVDESL